MKSWETLKKVIRLQQAKTEAFDNGIRELESYLESSKFANDTTVQVKDVLTRIRAARQAASDIDFEE